MINHEDAFIPILKILSEGTVMSRKPLIDAAADQMEVDEETRRVMLPSGVRPTYRNRISWAVTYLKKAGFLSQPKYGQYTITEEGLKVLGLGLQSIDSAWLLEHSASYASWVKECRKGRRQRRESTDTNGDSQSQLGVNDGLTPEDALEQAHLTLKSELSGEILDSIKEQDPAFFERLVVRLLVKMGYGGSFDDAARSMGQSGDGGIDGIIKEDRLGLDAIYLQAKRYQGSVGRPAVQAFVGALTGHRAQKGVFITTGVFTRDANEYVKSLDKTVVLIDGERLADLMIEYGLGVTLEQTYEVKRMDSDFFED